MIRKIFSWMKFSRSKTDDESAGAIYSLWLLLLPLLMGFVIGRLADVGLGYGLDILAGDAGQRDFAVTGTRLESDSGNERRGLEGFIASNPFKISPQKSNAPVQEKPKPVVEEKPKEPETSLNDIVLRGTLPGIGAWFDVNNELKLILVGKSIENYKLISVEYSEAMFRRGKEKPIKKFIVYGPVNEVKKAEAPAPKPAAQAPAPSAPPAAPKQEGNIIAAIPGSQEGQLPGEMVTNLVQNPFDELKRIRMRPNEKAGGLEVQWIQNDSLLKRLGVQRGDVIRSVNGIPFTNMGDIANSITSLMTSERFDVEVTRGGENTALRYVVK